MRDPSGESRLSFLVALVGPRDGNRGARACHATRFSAQSHRDRVERRLGRVTKELSKSRPFSAFVHVYFVAFRIYRPIKLQELADRRTQLHVGDEFLIESFGPTARWRRCATEG